MMNHHKKQTIDMQRRQLIAAGGSAAALSVLGFPISNALAADDPLKLWASGVPA